jgi:transposase
LLKPAPDENMRFLKDLYVAREALIKDRTAAKNRQKNQSHPLLKRQTEQRLKEIAAQLKDIKAEILTIVRKNQNLSRRFDILASVPGLGVVTTMALLIGMPEIGGLGPKRAAALASPPSRASLDSGAARPKSWAAGPIFGAPSTCRP